MKAMWIAILLISIGIFIMLLELLPYFQNVSGGVIFFIGPIPIIIGFGASLELFLLLFIVAIIGLMLLIKLIF